MMVLGFSVSELIKAVDATVRLCESVKNATGEFQGLSKRLEFSSKVLKAIGELKTDLIKSAGYDISLLDEACNEYQTTLKDLRSYLETYKTLKGSGDGVSRLEQIRWAVKKRYDLTSQTYQSRIIDHENRIAFLLQVGNMWAMFGQLREEIHHSVPEEVSPGQFTDPFTASSASLPPSIISEDESSQPGSQRSSIVSTPITPTGVGLPSAVPLSGKVKLWYRQGPAQGSALEFIRVSSIAVQRDDRGNIRGFLITNPSDENIYHTLCEYRREGSQSPLMEHQLRFENIRQRDSTVGYLVKFNGTQRVSKYIHGNASERVISRRALEYSFEEKEDCINFQSKVVGKALLLCAEVEKIESHRCSIESKWGNLQLWEGDRVRTIKFFSIKENKLLEFNTAHLNIKDSKPERLSLKFKKNGEELERKLKFLEIKFTKPGDFVWLIKTIRIDTDRNDFINRASFG